MIDSGAHYGSWRGGGVRGHGGASAPRSAPLAVPPEASTPMTDGRMEFTRRPGHDERHALWLYGERLRNDLHRDEPARAIDTFRVASDMAGVRSSIDKVRADASPRSAALIDGYRQFIADALDDLDNGGHEGVALRTRALEYGGHTLNFMDVLRSAALAAPR